jgi:hypothetical protein
MHAVTRPENIWLREEKHKVLWMRHSRWWLELHQRLWEDGKKRANTVFFKKVFGRQDTTAVFRHRNWVWHRPKEGWTLYVDKRGPAFHVPMAASAEEAWDAWGRFKTAIETYLEA